nr:uncharacterized protein LOC123493985 [Aegilops tauschii subsp. strangulata]
MVLVNGSGIGTGSSSYVPNYNPRDIIANLKRLLNEEAVVPMDPWYKGFKGSLKKTSSKAAAATYTIAGVIEQVDDMKLKITELPIRCWTRDYREFLKSMCPSFLEEIRWRWNYENVEFDIFLSEQNMNIAKQEGLEKKFNLTTTIGTTNMHLFDSDGKIRKYDTPEDILTEFFKLRLEYYRRRKEVMLENIGKELLKPKNQVRFILAVISGDIVVSNRKRSELFLELKHKGYEPLPKRKNTAKEVDEENDYEYLLAMPIGTLTLEKVQELVARQKKLEDELESLGKATPEILWLRDLAALEKELDVSSSSLYSFAPCYLSFMFSQSFILIQVLDAKEAEQETRRRLAKNSIGEKVLDAKEAEQETRRRLAKYSIGEKVCKAAHKKQRKKTHRLNSPSAGAAVEAEVLKPIGSSRMPFRTSLYADDAVIFINPDPYEIASIKQLLQLFGNATGLHTNFEKSSFTPIRCEGLNLSLIMGASMDACKKFPCKYLGMPLSDSRLKMVDYEEYIDKILSKVRCWKLGLLGLDGRLMLVKQVLSAMVVFQMIALAQPIWLHKLVDKIRRGFLWECKEVAVGGKCLVSWKLVCRPKMYGGLGISNMQAQGMALRLRWLWQSWNEPDKPWACLPMTVDKKLNDLFNASVKFVLGNGERIKFWYEPWLNGVSLSCAAPDLFACCTRKNLTVSQALQDGRWIRHLRRPLTPAAIIQYTKLWQAVADVHLLLGTPDSVIWRWTPNGAYSSATAYAVQFEGCTRLAGQRHIWAADAPLKCIIFAWLVILGKCLTADNLQKRGWPHDPICSLCRAADECADHLLARCSYTQALWSLMLNRCNLPTTLAPTAATTSLADWWESNVVNANLTNSKGWGGLAVAIWWFTWCERNARIFQSKASTVSAVFNLMIDEFRIWNLAGRHRIQLFLDRPREQTELCADKKTAAKPQKENFAGSNNEDFETKPAAQKKKRPNKASASMEDDEDEALELTDRLAVYNFDDSPPEHSAIKTETTEGQQEGKKGKNEPSKRGPANKATTPLTELSSENEDKKFTVEEVQVANKTGGRKPAAEKPKKTTNRKRAPAQSNSGDPSPEKKVRKMSDSFNKKSGLVPQTVASASTATEDAEAPLPSGSSAQPIAPRRSAMIKLMEMEAMAAEMALEMAVVDGNGDDGCEKLN